MYRSIGGRSCAATMASRLQVASLEVRRAAGTDAAAAAETGTSSGSDCEDDALMNPGRYWVNRRVKLIREVASRYKGRATSTAEHHKGGSRRKGPGRNPHPAREQVNAGMVSALQATIPSQQDELIAASRRLPGVARACERLLSAERTSGRTALGSRWAPGVEDGPGVGRGLGSASIRAAMEVQSAAVDAASVSVRGNKAIGQRAVGSALGEATAWDQRCADEVLALLRGADGRNGGGGQASHGDSEDDGDSAGEEVGLGASSKGSRPGDGTSAPRVRHVFRHVRDAAPELAQAGRGGSTVRRAVHKDIRGMRAHQNATAPVGAQCAATPSTQTAAAAAAHPHGSSSS